MEFGVWISCEERLPQEEDLKINGDTFIIQDENDEIFSTEYKQFVSKKYKSFIDGYDNEIWCCNSNVVAWMYLPKKYRAKKKKAKQSE